MFSRRGIWTSGFGRRASSTVYLLRIILGGRSLLLEIFLFTIYMYIYLNICTGPDINQLMTTGLKVQCETRIYAYCCTLVRRRRSVRSGLVASRSGRLGGVVLCRGELGTVVVQCSHDACLLTDSTHLEGTLSRRGR